MAELKDVVVEVKYDFGRASAFLKAHERLLIVVLVVAAVYAGYSKYVNWQAEVSKRDADKAEQLLAEEKQKSGNLEMTNKQDQASTDAVFAKYQALVQTLAASNAQLQSTVVSLQAGLKAQKQKNDQLDAQGMAARMSVIENLPLTNFTANGDLLLLSNAAAHQVLNDLESVPVLKQTVAAKDNQIKNDQTQIAGLQGVVTQQAEQIGGLKATITQDAVTLAASEANTVKQVKAQKDADRKSRLGWFRGGLAIGYAAGIATAHLLHL